MKNIIILGAGQGQISLIKYVKELGYRAIVVSPQGNYPGILLGDEVYLIDVRDKEKVLELAKSKKISAIITDSLDIAVPTVAYVSECLGLKSIGFETSLLFQNKNEMKLAAKKIGVKCASFFKASTLMDIPSKINFPCIIKPVDAAGSRGIYKISSNFELHDVFDTVISYSKAKEVIIEEIIHGDEYIVNSFVSNGKNTNLIIGDCSFFSVKNKYIAKSRIFKAASLANAIENKILDMHSYIIKNFGLHFGIAQGEYFYYNGEVYLNEIAARGGGIFISSDIIPLCTSVNAQLAYIKASLEELYCIEIKDNNYAAILPFLLPEGVITEISGIEEVLRINGVYDFKLQNIVIGYKTNSPKDKSSRMGPILIYGKTHEEILKIIEKVKKTLTIKVLCTDSIERGIIWD